MIHQRQSRDIEEEPSMVDRAVEAVECVAAFGSYACGINESLSAPYNGLEVFWTLRQAETERLVRTQLTVVFGLLLIFFCLRYPTVNVRLLLLFPGEPFLMCWSHKRDCYRAWLIYYSVRL